MGAIEEKLKRVEEKLLDMQFQWGSRCVGFDRDFNSYFVFTCMHGLYRCSAHSWYSIDTTNSNSSSGSGGGSDGGSVTGDSAAPARQQRADEWRVYITKAEVGRFLDSLDVRGAREKALKAAVEEIFKNEYLTCMSEADIEAVEQAEAEAEAQGVQGEAMEAKEGRGDGGSSAVVSADEQRNASKIICECLCVCVCLTVCLLNSPAACCATG